MEGAVNGSSETVKCHLREARRYLYDNAKRFEISSDTEIQQIELPIFRNLVEGLLNCATIELNDGNHSGYQYFFREAEKHADGYGLDKELIESYKLLNLNTK